MRHPASVSQWLIWLTGAFFLALGVYFTSAIFLSPQIEVVGVVSDASLFSGGRRWKSCQLIVATRENPHLLTVSPAVCRAVKVTDTVRVVYRDWDLEGIQVEILSGRERGRVWKRHVLDNWKGPLCLLLGFGALWVAAFGLKTNWLVNFTDTKSGEKDT